MRRLVIAATLMLLAACKSSAPYTVPAAILNTGVAVGASAAQRASGGCYATCANGTACNPRTGYCEPISAQELCGESEGGGIRCVPLATPIGIGQKAEPTSGGLEPPLGVSPATGSVPPPPAEGSPKRP